MLGSAIAFGVMILIVANSFSHGISDIMFNKIVVYVAGHVNVTASEGRGQQKRVFRDKERFERIVKEKAGADLVSIDEGVGVFLRAIGNGRAENMVLVGVESNKPVSKEEKKELDESFHMLDGGKFADLSRTDIENPLILPVEKAKILGVKKGETVRVKFQNIYGQQQTARLTVIGVLANDNIFMSGVMFCELRNVKQMLGYRPWECAPLQLRIKDPQKNAVLVADRIHDALIAGPAYIWGEVSFSKKSEKATVLPFMGNNDDLKALFSSNIKLASGKSTDCFGSKGVIVSEPLAKKLGVAAGKKIEVNWKGKFEQPKSPLLAEVTGTFKPDKNTGTDVIYMNESVFYPAYYGTLPDEKAEAGKYFYPAKDAPFFAALGKEFVNLDRTRSTEDLQRKMREVTRKKIKAATIDVNSMYESASDVLKLEGALNLITLGAVLVLFFIILVGVINTLRMTIRERTREIGTIRAIGMQAGDVRRIFILETAFLTLFSALAGTVLAFIVMGVMSLIPFNMTDNPLGMLLVNKHLYFMPTFGGVAGNILLILVIASITAFFPARRAAKMSAADALRHFE